MQSEREPLIDECVECCVRNRDFSKKKVFRCEFCDRLFCEKHIEPRLAFIPNFNPTKYSPELEVLYYQERKRLDGHPDFSYSRMKFEEMDIEEKTRNELIKQALDRMNAHYRGSYAQPINNSLPISRNDCAHKPEKPIFRKPSFHKPKLSLNIDWRTKNLLRSLKFWFISFWIAVGFLFLLEGNSPTSFYNSVPDPVKYVLYIFAAGISGWIGYRIFEKFDANPTSDRGVFGLKILSGLLLMAGVFMLVFGAFYGVGFFTESIFNPTLSIARTTVMVFIMVLGMALMLISGYLLFKFERRSGIIVYRR
ncbi:MAG: hypothetical protein NWE99_10420 [Candidatus Bathyarchaeota archaeon]|nr:hypothetical protein [Candidatus Bathyarchaeota archaeon]